MTDITLFTTSASHYVSTVCQSELATLFVQYAQTSTPQHDADGLTVFELPDERHERDVLLVHDLNPGRRPDFDGPEAVKGLHRALHVNRSSSVHANAYFLYTLAPYHSDILAVVEPLSPDVCRQMRQVYAACCSVDSSAMADAQRLASATPGVMQWAKERGYVYAYADAAKSERQSFCDGDYDAFFLDGVFMLTDSSSAMAYVARDEGDGLVWYGEHLDYGIEQDAEGDEANEDRTPFAMEHFFLKYIFMPENRIAYTVGDTLVAVDAKIDQLSQTMLYVHKEITPSSVENTFGNGP